MDLLNGPLGLGIVLSLKDEATAAMDRIRSGFAQVEGASGSMIAAFERNVSRFKAGVALMGAGVSTLYASFKVAQPAGEFEYALQSLGAVSGATAVELEQMRSAAMAAGLASQYAPTEAVAGMRELAAQGLTAKEAIETLTPTLQFAAGSLGELGVAESAALAAQSMKAFGVQAKDVGLGLDQMLKSANLFALAPKDLPLALGDAARGAQTLHQSLSETLVALGMVKNVIPMVGTASTATAVAMEKLVDPSSAKHFKGLVTVWDQATGKARPFLDIMQDLNKKLSGMSDEKRSGLLMQAFGERGIAGANAIFAQLNNGIEDANGKLLKGAAVVKYYRDQLEAAGGTSKEFSDRLLNTFAGQEKQLKASVETLKIALGGGFAEAFKPITKAALTAIRYVTGLINAIPAETRAGLAKLVIAFGVFATFAGSLLALKGILAAFGVGFAAAGSAFLSFISPVIPVLLGLGAVMAAVFGGALLLFKAFQVNAEQSGGGITRAFASIHLAFQGLYQAFTQGAFSGAVMTEIDKAENSGIKSFVIRLYVLGGRVENFFRGLARGFRAGVAEMAPAFDRVREALGFVFEALGIVNRSANENLSAFATAGAQGESFGEILSRLAAGLANLVTGGIVLFGGAIKVAHVIWDAFGTRITAVWEIFKGLAEFLGGFFSGDWRMMWMGAVDFAFGAIKFLIGKILALPRLMAHVADAIAGTFGVQLGAADAAKTFEKFAVDDLDRMKGDLKDSIGYLMGPTPEQQKAARQKAARDEFLGTMQASPLSLLRFAVPSAGVLSPPAAIEAPWASLASRADRPAASLAAAVPMMSAMPQAYTYTPAGPLGGPTGPAVAVAQALAPQAPAPPPAAPAGPRTQEVNVSSRLVVDNQTLAEAVTRARHDQEARSFSVSSENMSHL